MTSPSRRQSGLPRAGSVPANGAPEWEPRQSGQRWPARVVDTGVENPDAHTLLKLGYEAWKNGGRETTQVEALNDQSDVFFDTDLYR